MIYLINEVSNRYRWVSIVENEKDWGLKLAKIRSINTLKSQDHIDVEWTPETLSRPICDFPVFVSKLKCINVEKIVHFFEMLDVNGSWINLCGLSYVGFFCETTLDALNDDETENRLKQSDFGSFHSSQFSPSLNKSAIMKADIFKVPESINKIFVTDKFKDLYDGTSCTGLEFIPVDLV
jgi:hypothetical protein